MSSLRVFYPLLLIAIIATLAGCGGGSDSSGTRGPVGRVEGHVYVSANQALLTRAVAGAQPLAGATVRVQGTNLSTTTQADGGFILMNVPVGLQTVVISCSGYQGASLSVNVPANDVVNISDSILSPSSRKWTVLVFMNADNDLEGFGVQDVNEMESVPDSDDVAVLVQMDRAPGYDTSNQNWTDTRRMKIQHDDDATTMTSPVLEQMGEMDMGQPSTLRDFITWGKTNYPAEHYMVIIWNHGSGWRTAATSAVTRGVSFDDSSGTYIRTVDLPAALSTAPPLDIVSFDASLMQMLEIAYEIRHECSYVVGSEESPPGPGYAYQTWLGPLVENPDMSPRDLGVTMARETLDYYGTLSDITHSVIDTTKLSAVATALDSFAGELLAVTESRAAQLAEARSQAEYFAYNDYKDLAHYAQLVRDKVGGTKVRATADGLIAAIKNATVAEYHASYHPNAHGISIFVPVPATYGREAARYIPLALSKDTRWDEFLARQQQ